MADFCTHCAKEMGFDSDFDVEEAFNKLELEHFIRVGLCEGCGVVGVGRMSNNKVMIYYYDKEDPVIFNTIEEYKANHKGKQDVV